MDADRFTHAVVVTGSRQWRDEATMRRVFNEIWWEFGHENIERPVLLHGACPTGADAMAEKLWLDAEFETLPFPADWSRDGRAAGPLRNQRMIDAAQVLREAGTKVVCAAFLSHCRDHTCTRWGITIPGLPTHLSHGTAHCRSLAMKAGIEVKDAMANPTATSMHPQVQQADPNR